MGKVERLGEVLMISKLRVKKVYLCILLLCSIGVTACQQSDMNDGTTRENEKTSNDQVVNLYEVQTFNEVKEETLVAFSDTASIRAFHQAVMTAKQLAGVVDMDNPHYLFEINGQKYYLWLTFQHNTGSIMNVEDTHTLYTLSRESGRQLVSIVQGSYR